MRRLQLSRGVGPPMNVLGMTLNCIWWRISSLIAFGNMGYHLIAIVPWSTQTRIGTTRCSLINRSNRSVQSFTKAFYFLLLLLFWEFYFTPQVSRTLLSILGDLNNAVVWMVSTCLLISNSFSPFIKLLDIIPREPITIGITVTFMLHSFFTSLARSRYLFFCSLSFNFTLCAKKWTLKLF